VAKQNIPPLPSGYNPVLEAVNQLAANQLPVFDESGKLTGDMYDQRLGTPEDQPDPQRLRDYINQKYGGRAPRLQAGGDLGQFDPVDPYQSEGFLDSAGNVLKSSTNESLMGLLFEAAAGQPIFDMHAWQPSGIESTASSILSFLNPVDVAVLAAGGGAGGLALKGAAKVGLGSIAKTALAQGVARGAGALGLYDAARELITSRGDIAAAGKHGLHGAAIGAALGVVPTLVAPLSRMGPIIQRIGEATGEIGVFGSVSPFIEEGRAPTIDDYKNAAVFVVGMKAARSAGEGVKKLWTKARMAKEVETVEEALRMADESLNSAVETELMTSGLTRQEVQSLKKALPAPNRLALPAPGQEIRTEGTYPGVTRTEQKAQPPKLLPAPGPKTAGAYPGALVEEAGRIIPRPMPAPNLERPYQYRPQAVATAREQLVSVVNEMKSLVRKRVWAMKKEPKQRDMIIAALDSRIARLAKTADELGGKFAGLWLESPREIIARKAASTTPFTESEAKAFEAPVFSTPKPTPEPTPVPPPSAKVKPVPPAEAPKVAEKQKTGTGGVIKGRPVEAVQYRPVKAIEKDVDRFQNRDTEYSKERVDAIVEEGWNQQAVARHPIVLWLDPQDGKTYVISGHSRLEAAKRLGIEEVPTTYFEGNEAEARAYARDLSNRESTGEGAHKDIASFRHQLEQGASKKKLIAMVGADRYPKYEAWSKLSPKGKFIEILGQNARDGFPYIERWAQRIGKAREYYGEKFTNRHEDQLFDFLYPKEGKNNSAYPVDKFDAMLDRHFTDISFNKDIPISIARIEQETAHLRGRKDTGAILREIDDLKELRASAIAKGQQDAVALVAALDRKIARAYEALRDTQKNQGDIFGSAEPKAPAYDLHSSTVKGKTVHLLKRADSWKDFGDAVQAVIRSGGNLYIDPAIESTDIFKKLQAEKALSERRIDGRYRVNIKSEWRAPSEGTRTWVGGVAAREIKTAKFFSKDTVEMIKENLRKVKPVFLLQLKNRFKTKEGKYMSLLVDEVYKRHHERFGRYFENLRNEGVLKRGATEELLASKLFKSPKSMTEEEGLRLADDLDSGRAPGVAKILKDFHSEIKTIFEREGIPFGEIENYFPRYLKRDVADRLYGSIRAITAEINADKKMSRADMAKQAQAMGLTPNEFDNKIIRTIVGKHSKETLRILDAIRDAEGLTLRQALRLLDREVQSQILPTPSFMKRRSLTLPSELYERDARVVLPIYLNAMSKYTAETDVFGRNAYRAINMVRRIQTKDGDEGRLALQMLKTLTGEIEVEKGYTGAARTFWDAYTNFEVATKIALGRATLLNTAQAAISFLPEMGVWRSIRGGIQIFERDTRSRLRATGAVDQYLLDAVLGYPAGGKMGAITQKLSYASGFTGVNRLLLYWSASTFDVAARDWHRIAQGSGARAEWARGRLRDYHLDYRKPIAEQERELSKGTYAFARDSQLQRNILNEPAFFNDPRVRPFVLFKRFGYRQAAMMKDMLKREVQRGNVLPILRLGAAGFLGGEMVIWAANQIQSALSGQPAYRTDDKLWEHALNNMTTIGAFGIVSDMMALDDITSLPDKVKFALMPVIVNDSEKILAAGSRFLKDWHNYGDVFLATERNAHTVFDLAGSYPRAASQRLLTDSQQADRIANLKGKEKEAIYKLLLSGDGEAASKRVEQWNKAYPNRRDALKYSDVSYGALAKYLRRKMLARLDATYEKGTPEYNALKRKLTGEIANSLAKARK